MLILKRNLLGQDKRVKNYLRAFTSAILIAISLLIPLSAAAPALAATSSGNGFRISPPRYEISVPAGTSQTVSIFVENLANSQVTAHPIVNNFTAGSKENGDPQLLLDTKAAQPANNFIKLVQPVPDTSIAALERKEIKVTLNVPANATPGGYYGAIRFQPLFSSATGASRVTLTASVGTLFLVTVPGNLTQKMQLASFNASHNGSNGTLFNSGPVSIVTRLRNTGNIHLQPFGKVVVKNTFGKIVDTEELNGTDPRGNVLPGTIRRFDNPLNIKHMFGKYTAIGNFAYGDNGDIVAAKATFYVIPYVLIIIVVLILGFLIFGLPRLIRWYNRRVITKAQGKDGGPDMPAGDHHQNHVQS